MSPPSSQPLAAVVLLPDRLIIFAGSTTHGAVAAATALLALIVHHETLDDAGAVAPLAFAVAVTPQTCAHVRLLNVLVGKTLLHRVKHF